MGKFFYIHRKSGQFYTMQDSISNKQIADSLLQKKRILKLKPQKAMFPKEKNSFGLLALLVFLCVCLWSIIMNTQQGTSHRALTSVKINAATLKKNGYERIGHFKQYSSEQT